MNESSLTDDDRDLVARQIARAEVRNLTLLGLAITLVAGVGCWFVKWENQTFASYVLVSDQEIALHIPCNGDSRSRLWEFDDRVEIRLDARTPANDEDCLSFECVTLVAVLGNRAVVDERSGHVASQEPFEATC